MRKTRLLAPLALLMSVVLTACGGGGDSGSAAFQSPTVTSTSQAAAKVAAMQTTASAATLPSDGTGSVDIKVFVRDANNVLLPNVPVTFTATSGGLSAAQATSDASGVATVTLTTAGDPAARTITVTAKVGTTLTNTVNVTVVTTVAKVTLASSVPSLPSDGSATATLTATVKDVAGAPIAGVAVAFDAPTGVLTVNQGVTNASGVATAVLSVGTDTSNRTITATATAGSQSAKTTVTVATQVAAISISSNVTVIPTDGTSLATITAIVRGASNQFVAGVPVSFAASSGGIAVTQAVTDANGVATATLSTAGDATPRTISVTATAAGIQSSPITVQVSGVGVNSVASVIVGSSASALPTDGSQTATITATVRNASNVGISGVPVSFAASSGSLAVVTAVTDSSGNATATLAIGPDHSTRNITVNATAAGVSGSTTVSVGGLYVVTVTTSSPSILSDGSAQADIRAYVRNANNQFVQGVTVSFAATSGGIAVTQAVTDSSGAAIAKLSPASDPTNRTITVTASASGISAQVNVDVTGTRISVQGPDTLSASQAGSYTAQLLDAGGHPIVGKGMVVSASAGNTLSGTSFVTDANGRINFTMTGQSTAGTATITVAGAGATGTKSVVVSAELFTLSLSGVGTEINFGASRTVTLTWTNNGVGVSGQTITFSTTRGTVTPVGSAPITATTATTDASGVATATLAPGTAAGGAIVTASSGTPPTNKSAQLSVEFVATTPATINLQPDLFTIAPGQSTNVTAVVRDATGNLVKNQVVLFTLNDLSGGSLSTGAVTTDSTGRATTVYTAGSLTNPSVAITGKVQAFPSVTGSTTLAVGKQALFITLGTGNSIDEPNVAQYHLRYQVQVTDANGNGVANVALSAKALSMLYMKGVRTVSGTKWITTVNATCNDEDVNRNGVLDFGEDINNSGKLEAGNVVTVTPSNATTDSNGFANLDLYYPQEYAYYLNVNLSVSTTLQGTEYTRTSNLTVPGTASDFSDVNTAPPGLVSPFGQAALCTNPN